MRYVGGYSAFVPGYEQVCGPGRVGLHPGAGALRVWESGVQPHVCRYLSHFRSVHRGAYFAELRTTTVRKLLPESWGFLCPVHTPDGSPCGLLNHFTAECRIVTTPASSPQETHQAVVQVGAHNKALCCVDFVNLRPYGSSLLASPARLIPATVLYQQRREKEGQL